jgi:hypothetical protein
MLPRSSKCGRVRPPSRGARPGRLLFLPAVVAGYLVVGSPPANGDETSEVVAVYASTSPAYVRKTDPGGGFRNETYAFGEGGQLDGAQRGPASDPLRFVDIARSIAPALAAHHYQPCDQAQPSRTDLLIMVYWGTTVGTSRTSSEAEYALASELEPPPMAASPPPPTGQGGTAMVSDPSTSGRNSEGAMRFATKVANDALLQQSLTLTTIANNKRDRQDYANAAILGYLPELQRVRGLTLTSLNQRRQDVIDEVEDSRYYVVLMAYDFQSLLQRKERKLLWETRFSIRRRRHDFGRELAAMSASASRFFGRNSDGLVRTPMPTGRVEIGETKFLGYEPEKK